MNSMMLLQAAPQGAAGSSASMWIMLILIFVVMWFFMIRPQRKQQKELQQFRSSLKKGDKVVTVGGIYGEIVEVNEKTALIKVDGDTKLSFRKDKEPSPFNGEGLGYFAYVPSRCICHLACEQSLPVLFRRCQCSYHR